MSLNFFHNAFPDVQLLTNCHRMFLREIIARQCVTRGEAREILQEILDTYENCTDGRRNISLYTIIEDLNKVLPIVRFRIVPVRAEYNGKVYIMFINDEGRNVEIGQGGGKNILSNVFRVIFHYLTTSNTALTYSQAQNLRSSAQQILTDLGKEQTTTTTTTARQRQNTNQNTEDDNTGTTSSARNINVKQWNDSLDTLIHQYWLSHNTVTNEIFLGPRASGELKQKLSSMFGDAGKCAICHTPCVTPDRNVLEDTNTRKHICCANGTLDKNLHDKDILTPHTKYNTDDNYNDNTQTTTITSSKKGSTAKKSTSGTNRRRGRGDEEEEEDDIPVPNDDEEEEEQPTQRRGRRK